MRTEGLIIEFVDDEQVLVGGGGFGEDRLFVRGIAIDNTFLATRDIEEALVFDTSQQVLEAVRRRNTAMCEVVPQGSLGQFIVSRVVIEVTLKPEALIDNDEGAVMFNWSPFVAEGEEQEPIFVNGEVTLDDLADKIAEDSE